MKSFKSFLGEQTNIELNEAAKTSGSMTLSEFKTGVTFGGSATVLSSKNKRIQLDFSVKGKYFSQIIVNSDYDSFEDLQEQVEQLRKVDNGFKEFSNLKSLEFEQIEKLVQKFEKVSGLKTKYSSEKFTNSSSHTWEF